MKFRIWMHLEKKLFKLKFMYQKMNKLKMELRKKSQKCASDMAPNYALQWL